MGKQEVNKHMLKMGSSEQETSEEIRVKKMDILKDFQVSFFSMSRLPSFPWTVSMVWRIASRQSPFKNVPVRVAKIRGSYSHRQNMTGVIL